MLYGDCGRRMKMDRFLRVGSAGATGFLGDCLSEDDELRQLVEGVASAGSLAVWMGVFSRSWMKVLVAGGLTYKRARIVTGLVRPMLSLLSAAMLLRSFVMSGRSRKAQRRRSGDRNSSNRGYVRNMGVMGGGDGQRRETAT
jgi:hypothetical protein